MNLQDITPLDTVKYCTYVLNEYKKMYLVSKGLLNEYQNLANKYHLKGWKNFTNKLTSEPTKAKSNNLTPTEKKRLENIEKEIEVLKSAKRNLLETGIKNHHLSEIDYYHIETQLKDLINKINNEKIITFNEHLTSTALPKLNFIEYKINEELQEEIKHLYTLQSGKLPMFLDDFNRLVAFIVDIEQIQFIQYLANLKNEFESNPNKAEIEDISPQRLTARQISILFNIMQEKGILHLNKIGTGTKKEKIEFIGKLFGFNLGKDPSNSSLANAWSEAENKNDRKQLLSNEKINQGNLKRLLELIENEPKE